ncbi:MAG TPA: GGDEF domain-containing protein [Herpetosiphonaceae bacterium]
MRLTHTLFRIFVWLEQRSPTMLVVTATLLVGIIAWLDAATGSEIAFGLFYLLPIGTIAWLISYRWGLTLAGFSTLLYFIGDMITRPFPYAYSLIPVWNTSVRFSFFAIVVWLLASLRAALDREKMLARTDYLTGAANSRAFWEIASQELTRAQRYNHSLTLISFDVDNFKLVNDKLGHPAGDRLLQQVVRTARSCLRSHDVIARLGGDEFAILLPETDYDAAVTVSHKVQSHLLATVQGEGYPVTFSIGVVTCVDAHISIERLIQRADDVMYKVKNTGKNAIACILVP